MKKWIEKFKNVTSRTDMSATFLIHFEIFMKIANYYKKIMNSIHFQIHRNDPLRKYQKFIMIERQFFFANFFRQNGPNKI